MSELPQMDHRAKEFVESIYAKASAAMIEHALHCPYCLIENSRLVGLCPPIREQLAKQVAICDCTCMDVLLSGAPMNKDVLCAINSRMDWQETTDEHHG